MHGPVYRCQSAIVLCLPAVVPGLCHRTASVRHEYLLNEVFCILHILAAFFALYWWARLLRIRPSLAMAVALSFVLSGYVLVLGRSWTTVLISCCWVIPLGIAVTLLQRGAVGLRWVVGTGMAIGLSYYIGFPQGWAYSLAFFIIALLLLVATGGLAKPGCSLPPRRCCSGWLFACLCWRRNCRKSNAST